MGWLQRTAISWKPFRVSYYLIDAVNLARHTWVCRNCGNVILSPANIQWVRANICCRSHSCPLSIYYRCRRRSEAVYSVLRYFCLVEGFVVWFGQLYWIFIYLKVRFGTVVNYFALHLSSKSYISFKSFLCGEMANGSFQVCSFCEWNVIGNCPIGHPMPMECTVCLIFLDWLIRKMNSVRCVHNIHFNAMTPIYYFSVVALAAVNVSLVHSPHSTWSSPRGQSDISHSVVIGIGISLCDMSIEGHVFL